MVTAGLLCAALGAAPAAHAAHAPPDWTELASAAGQVYDADADRILFQQSLTALAVLDRHTGAVTTVPSPADEEVVGGFLSPRGALVVTEYDHSPYSSLHEWRDGTQVFLGTVSARGSVAVAGDYAIWMASPTLHRRDLEAGATVDIAGAGNGNHDVAANGDVTFWTFDHAVRRYRGGLTETLADPPGELRANDPLTDGTNVVWRQTSSHTGPEFGSLQGHGPSGPFALPDTDRGHWPIRGADYLLDGGWIAFTRGEFGEGTVWRRNPLGEIEGPAPAPAGADTRLRGLNEDGDVIYGPFGFSEPAHLWRAGEAPIAIPNPSGEWSRGYGDFLFSAGDRWYRTVGGSLQRLRLSADPVGGSQTTIDDGPQGAVASDSAQFEFSSPIAAATFECRLDGGAWEACESPKAYSSLASGSHTFLVRADGDPDPASQAWMADTAAPTPTIRTPAAGGSSGGSPLELDGLPGTAHGDGPVTAQLFAGSTTTGAPVREYATTRFGQFWIAKVSTDLPEDGQYTARAKQTDAAGNEGFSEGHLFVLDTQPPQPFALRAPGDGWVVEATTSYEWDEAVDAGTGVNLYRVRIRGPQDHDLHDVRCSAGVCTALHPPPLPPGGYTWSVEAHDHRGHIRTSATRSFTVLAPFELLAPADGARTGDATPTLAWEPAAHDAPDYEVWIDGARVATGLAATDFTPAAPLADGEHSWFVRAVDEPGDDPSAGPRTFRVDTTPPVASLRAAPGAVLPEDPVVLDASGSSDADGGRTVRHEWDLDGDGAFERDTGPDPRTTTSFPGVGNPSPAVRVTDEVGNRATARTEVSVRAAPPPGFPGISIDDGARFTNDPDVTLTVVWVPLSTGVLVANDGGFAGATPLPLAAEIPWTLESDGAERLPKTVYARFVGLDGARETYQDDIILDETRPRVVRATVLRRAGRARRARAAAVRRRTYRLRIAASDNASGVTAMQITPDGRRPGRVRPYRRRATYRATRAILFVRVRDGAGNWSLWKRTRVRSARPA
ncbi:MAG TPA: hypothetical protein VHF89_17005 [Solirubrobacteraceae bacterium]|nr:hypothetical protein [Solirubrobacteraceae bacterium]